MTVLEAITKGAEFLARKQIQSPRLQVELLLAHLLELPRLKLYLNFERRLTESQSNALRDLLVQRASRVPLQHLTRSANFCGLNLTVSSAVLIPRPETELLAEQAWTFLNSLQSETRFLDVGTGSGCISIAIVAHASRSRGVAVDISSDALAVARQNLSAHDFANRVELREGGLLTTLQPAERFDVIVSNPPYIPTAEIELLEPEVRDHDPRLALDGGPDGLGFYRALAQGAAAHLQAGGRILLEFGDGQGPALRELFVAQGWVVHGIICDLAQKERILIASRP